MNTDNTNDIIAILRNVDDLCLEFKPKYNKNLLEDETKKHIRKSNSASER